MSKEQLGLDIGLITGLLLQVCHYTAAYKTEIPYREEELPRVAQGTRISPTYVLVHMDTFLEMQFLLHFSFVT